MVVRVCLQRCQGFCPIPVTDSAPLLSGQGGGWSGVVFVSSWPGVVPIDVEITEPATPVSWPALCRPSTTGGAGGGKVVNGRARPGHDTIATTVPRAR